MRRWTLLCVASLVMYSATLLAIELATSQDYARQFFTDIAGDVPFFAVNTTVSMVFLLGGALLLVFAVAMASPVPAAREAHPFFLSQAAMFAFLAADDRFQVHEKLSFRLGVLDEFVLLAWVALELALLLRYCRLRHFTGPSLRFFLAGAVLFGLMFAVDGLAPDRMMLRLSVEDLLKTWSAAAFFAFSYESASWHLRRHASGIAATASAYPRRRVLVLGEDTRIVLPIVRSLGRAGIEVHLAWCPPDEPATRSRYLTRLHAPSRAGAEDSAALDELRMLAASIRFDLIVPVTEAAVCRLQRARPGFTADLPLHLLEKHTFETCTDKARTWALGRSLGIPVPRTEIVEPGIGARDFSDWRFPVAVKSLVSVDPRAPLAKQFVRRAAHQGELAAVLRLAAIQVETVLVQEWFEGSGEGVEFLAHDGRILLAFQHRRLHETLGYGSTYRESSPLDPRLLEAVRALVAELRYTGVGMVEFRTAPRGNGFVLLEINPRFWGSLSLPVAVGTDFPLFLFQMLVEGRVNFPQGYRTGVRSRVLLDDVRWTWRALTGRTAPDVTSPEYDGWVTNPVSALRVLGDVVRGCLLLDRVDTFAWDDPAPVLADLVRLARTARFAWSRHANALSLPAGASTGSPTPQGVCATEHSDRRLVAEPAHRE
jgi:predicted ATP-grasp superfamily ATP-dependent carboligase